MPPWCEANPFEEVKAFQPHARSTEWEAEGMRVFSMRKSDDRFIDVQSHFLPSFYVDAMHAAGMTDIDGWGIPKWDVASAIANMDQLGISAQLLSLSTPGVSFLKGQQARDMARSINEFAASTIHDYSPRFGAFATLPLPDVDGSLEALSYALDTLKLDGVACLSNYAGLYVGQPEFDPILDELNRREATLFIHPGPPPNFASLGVGLTAPILEFPFETTRVAANLLRSGTIDRCPKLKIILPHGGGTIPFLQQRLAFAVGAERAALLSSFFYYDLTAAAMPGQLAALLKLVSPKKLLMGVDFPFMPAAMNAPFLASLEAAELSPQDRQDIRSGNAMELFPMLAERLAAQVR